MAYFAMSYDLRRKEEFDYSRLWQEFKRLRGVKFQESAFFIELTLSASDVKDHFVEFVHDDDLLMVIEFDKKPSRTRGLKGTSDWISARWN